MFEYVWVFFRNFCAGVWEKRLTYLLLCLKNNTVYVGFISLWLTFSPYDIPRNFRRSKKGSLLNSLSNISSKGFKLVFPSPYHFKKVEFTIFSNVYTPQITDNGNITTSILTFKPELIDHNKSLICRAENPKIVGGITEAVSIIDVTCRLTIFFSL